MSTARPTVFISYSWKPVTNQQKVIELAERLTNDSIHVIIDLWNLKEGQDKNQFMEQMVNSPAVKRVLLICNKDYVEKANKRIGGVGAESLIVSSEVYKQADQTKFIPVIFEYDENGKPYVPTFVNDRIYIDLSNEEIFEDEYEKLMRNLYDKPSSKRPPYGTPPAYVLDEEPIFLPTAHKVAVIKKSLIDDKRNTILLVQNYYETFLNALKDYQFSTENLSVQDFDVVVLKKINELTPLRDDFINFIETYAAYSIDIDIEKLHTFFEKLLDFLLNLDGIGSNYRSIDNMKNDHFRFFFYELFLHFSCIMVEKERFKELGYILHNTFIVTVQRHEDIKAYTFVNFRNHVTSLNEIRNSRLQLNRVSITADTLKERATGRIKFPDLQKIDALLYYISLLVPSIDYRQWWFPETSCYHYYGSPFMAKAVSKKFFEKVKPLFNVETKEELVSKVKAITEGNKDNFPYHQYWIHPMSYGLQIEKICTIS